MPSEQKTNQSESARREWSDIQQSEFRRSTSGVARRRKWTHIGRWVGMGAIALALVVALAFAFHSASRDSNALEPAAMVEKITFRTDGVLNEKWLSTVLDLKDGVTVSSLDLAKVRASIEAKGQIRSATVALRLPDELVVEVREQTPLLKARAQISPTEIKTLLISRLGVVYEGAGYPVNTLRALPYIDGVMLRMSATGFEPIGDMEPIANLLDKARVGWPKLYSDWRTVSFQRYHGPDSPVSFVEMHSRSMGTIIFSINDVEDQMRRLEKLVADGVTASRKPVVRIDLSIPGQAIVEYADNTSRTKGH